MSLKLVVPVAAMMAAGIGIGMVPVVNDNLRWYIWEVVPVSGALVGFGLAWLGFALAVTLNVRVSRPAMVALALAGGAGYAGSYYGQYLTRTFEVHDELGLRDGTYRTREFKTFKEYIRDELGETTIGDARSKFSLGRPASTAVFALDLLLCALAVFVTLNYAAASRPICATCSRYKKRLSLREWRLPPDTDAAQQIVDAIQDRTGEGRYGELAAYLEGLPPVPAPARSSLAQASPEPAGRKGFWRRVVSLKSAAPAGVRLTVEDRRCPQCSQSTLIGKFWVPGPKGGWQEVSRLGFRSESGTGRPAASSALLTEAPPADAFGSSPASAAGRPAAVASPAPQLAIRGTEGKTMLQLRLETAGGSRFVQYQYNYSLLVVSFKRASRIVYVHIEPEWGPLRRWMARLMPGLPYLMIAATVGWWGIPHGILWTFQSLWVDANGGRDVTDEVMAVLERPAAS